jgi:monoamine oxidase
MTQVKNSHYDCIIVGSGLAGLMAARNLTRGHSNVLVLEAQDYIGGRMFGKYIATNQYIDLGGQWVGPTQDRFLALLDEYKISRFPSPLHGKTVLIYQGKRFEFSGFFQGVFQGDRPDIAEEDWQDAMNAWSRFEKLAQSLSLTPPDNRPENQYLDRQTFAQWIKENTTTEFGHWYFSYMVRAVGFLGPAEPDEVSLLHVLWGHRCASQAEHPEAELIHDGAGQIPLKIASELEGKIRLNEPVIAISHTATEVEVTTLQNSYKARYVVVAMPPYQAGKINYNPPLPPIKQQLTQRYPMGTLAKLLISYETPFWREKGLAGVGMGTTEWIELFADSSDPRSGKGVLATFVMGDRYHRWVNLDDAQRKTVVLSDLAKYLGEEALSPTTFDIQDWPANQWVGGGYAGFMPPGVWTRFGQNMAEPFHRIYWAGTELAHRWAGFFDGAVRTGEMAAEEILTKL